MRSSFERAARPTRRASSPRGHGFTLIELMFVLVILSVLAALAYPAYAEAVRKARRAEARGQLLETMQYMQRFYAAHDRYDRAIGADVDHVLPQPYARVPRQGMQTYEIVLEPSALGASAYRLLARPMGPMEADRCGGLTLDSVGRRGVVDARPGMTVEDCWR